MRNVKQIKVRPSKHWKDRAAGWATRTLKAKCGTCGAVVVVTLVGTKDGCIDVLERRQHCGPEAVQS